MDRFFNMDNKFFQVMSRLADIMILNAVCLICCLPVVTIGPSLTALYYMTLKMMRNEESYLLRGFFSSFRTNLKQGIVINLILLALGLFLGLDFYAVNHLMTGMMSRFFFYFLSLVLLIYLMEFLYVYPVLARFYNTIRATMKNALLMAIRHLPYTLAMLFVSALPLIGFLVTEGRAPMFILLFFFLMGPAGLAFINSWFFVRIFDNYMPKEEETDGEAPLQTPGEETGWESRFPAPQGVTDQTASAQTAVGETDQAAPAWTAGEETDQDVSLQTGGGGVE